MSKMYSIKEVAELYGINANKLRYYEKKGLLEPKRHPTNKYREYSVDDLLLIQLILTYRALEVPIEKVSKLIKSSSKKDIAMQLFNQWRLANDMVHKYQNIRKSLDLVIDDVIEAENYDGLNDKIIKSSKNMQEAYRMMNAWEDKWHFDSWAETYDESIRRDHGGLNFYMNYDLVLKKVYEAVKETDRSGRVLDIGVGTGNLSQLFLEEFDVVGVDQSKQMLFKAKRKFPKLKLRMGEFLKLPFDHRSFDFIVTSYAFHHLTLDEKEHALTEMMRVLNEDGKIIIADMMFLDEKSKSSFCSKLSAEEINSVEDEFYTDIEKFSKIVMSHGLSCDYERIDELMYVMKIANK